MVGNSGITTALVLVLKMARQPRVLPVAPFTNRAQFREPTNKRPLLASRMFRWRPLGMLTAAEAAMVPVLMVWRVPFRLLTGVPATYRLALFKRPTVAPETGMDALKAGVAVLKFTSVTL